VNIFEAPPGVHCDNLIDDQSQPECLRNFLRYNRLPASCKNPGRNIEDVKRWCPKDLLEYVWTDPEPALFGDHDRKRVRVVMASRFGDVGITENLTATAGYSKRVLVSELSNFNSER
jgi:hypothetical protein